jgi:DNA topoisomerase-3
VSIAVLAEKPSVARDIAAVLGARARRGSAFEGNGYVVTWAVGHLVGLCEPQQMDARWRRWRFEALPMLPPAWPLSVREKMSTQFDAVRCVLNRRDVEKVVCATDAGREGELIFRYIYRQAGCLKPVERLWLSSLTPHAIASGFKALRPSREYDRLADAAEGRSRADWLVGMNLSRAYTVRFGPELLSVGRVQTPTLAMLVGREREIERFVPEKYCEVKADFGAYVGFTERLPGDGALAQAIAERCRGGTGEVASVAGADRRLPPPLLYDLTELQRHANRLFGFTAKKTLDVAQALYERHKVLTYPRTDSRHLSTAVAPEAVAAAQALAPKYGVTASGALSRRFVDDAKVTDHHAIVPTTATASGLSRDEQRLYDLVCRRLLMAWQLDWVTRVTNAVTKVGEDAFKSTGTQVLQAGWKALEVETKKKSDEPRLPDDLKPGQRYAVKKTEVLHKQTEPPKRFTDATLLTAMETAGKVLTVKELEDAMKERGLGTPATRAAILETLLERGYAERDGKSLKPTPRGRELVDLVHETVKSPQLTGEWELALKHIERGKETLECFMQRIEQLVVKVVRDVGEAPPPGAPTGRPPPPSQENPPAAQRPEPSSPQASVQGALAMRPPVTGPLADVLRERFGHAAFRPFQEDVCRTVADGGDALLVMPTGSGKSLCYQLPGLARGGTTLVISPLIALMEDQTARLQQLGFRAERIHSGRTREQSRAVCRDYLDGQLDFLTIAPERLSVPGFPELLARRKPTLIAVDEAHCISHWGHDFRPDYRLLGQRIPMLRPAPVLALTATATRRVQDDILAQLAVPKAARFIHGFRRDNLAVEAVECNPGDRLEQAQALLRSEGRLPALVYVPSRKLAEEVAEQLSKEHRAAPYHAGMDSGRRSRTQTAFLNSELDVVVATIAFGMGIDKPDIRTVAHLGLPASLEGYYQEIGRAGRDGKPSRVLLFYSWSDKKLHETFFERDYPLTFELEKLRASVPAQGIPRSQLAQEDEAALDKLWIHGGLTIGPDDVVRPGREGWQKSYEAIRAHRVAQLDEVLDFAQSSDCRMVRLIRHFGDLRDGRACGHCDACAPAGTVGRAFRAATTGEVAIAERVIAELARFDGPSTGTLYRNMYPGQEVERRAFETVLSAMERAKAVRLSDDQFDKDGKTIKFQRAHLLAKAQAAVHGAAFLFDEAKAPSSKKKKGKAKAAAEAGADPKLVEALRAWRLSLAKAQSVPAFRIMSDRVMLAIAAKRPSTLDALGSISGVGPKLVERHGRALLKLVR